MTKRNPNKDTIHNIKNWLRKQELDEDIPAKSKDRVLTQMARDIRAIKPLPSGRCNLCGKHVEQLIPVQLKVCKKCALKMAKRSNQLKLQKIESKKRHYCDICLDVTYKPILINAYLCSKCLKKIGKKHKNEMKFIREDQRKYYKKLRELMVKK